MTSETTTESSLRCPTCEGFPPLVAAGGVMLALRCDRCGSALLPPRGVARLRAALGDAARGLDRARSARTVTCASCGNPAPLVTLAAGTAAPCVACHAVWVDGALLSWAEAQLRAAQSAPAPAVEPPSASAPAPPAFEAGAVVPRRRLASPRALLVGGLALGLAGAVALWLLLPGAPAPSTKLPPGWQDAPLARAVGAPAPDAASPVAPGSATGADGNVAAPPSKPPSSTAAPSEFLAGGRTVAWWKDRLQGLHRAPDQESQALYRATLRRAEANGLVVAVDGSAITVTPGPAPASVTAP